MSSSSCWLMIVLYLSLPGCSTGSVIGDIFQRASETRIRLIIQYEGGCPLGRADHYRHGDNNVICDRCGFKYKASELKREWNGLYTCPFDWEPRHPQDLIKSKHDDQRPSLSRPEGEDRFVEGIPLVNPVESPLVCLGAFNIVNAVKSGEYTLPVGIEEAYSLFFDPTETLLFWAARDSPSDGASYIHRITLGVPGDVRTIIDASMQTYPLAGFATAVALNPAGTIMLTLGELNTIEQHSLTNFDLNTAAQVNSVGLGLPSSFPAAISVTEAGDRLHVATLDSGNSFIQGYTLTNFDINTLVRTVGDIFPNNVWGNQRIWQHYIRYDTGLRVWAVEPNRDGIREADFSTPLDLVSAVDTGDIASTATTNTGMTWRSNGSRVYTCYSDGGWLEQYDVFGAELTYRDTIACKNPLGYWRQNEIVGPVARDIAWPLNDGRFIGNPEFGVSSAITNPADSGTAIGYGPGKGITRIPFHSAYASSLANEFSVELWFKRSVLSANRVLFSQWAEPSGRGVLIWFDFSGFLELGWANDSGVYFEAFKTANRYADNQWHQLAVTYKNDTGKLYVDGAFVGQGGPVTINSVVSDLGIGAYSDTNNPDADTNFDGDIDEVSLFGKELTAQEVLDHYTISRPPIPPSPIQSYDQLIINDSPISYFRMTESSGPVLVDEMGANNGTYVGAVVFGEPGLIANDTDTAILITAASSSGIILDNPVILGVNWSLEAWIKRTTTANAFHTLFFNQALTMGFYTRNNFIDYYDGISRNSSLSFNLNESVHLVITLTGTTMRMYINGIETAINNPVSIGNMSDVLYIGFNGILEELDATMQKAAIYNYVLTPTQVLVHYNKGVGA